MAAAASPPANWPGAGSSAADVAPSEGAAAARGDRFDIPAAGRGPRLGSGLRRLSGASLGLLCLASPAAAHVSERALVLLLPTAAWIPAGTAAVAATAVLLALVPAAALRRAARPRELALAAPRGGRTTLSTVSAALLLVLVLLGWFGPRDPLGNLLPLTVWTLFFIGFPALQVLAGDLWAWANPWTGPLRLLAPSPPPLRLPERLGQWPAALSWLAVAAFLLVDPAPADPARLAAAVALYWAAILALLLLFGEAALPRVEGFTAWLALFAALSPFGARGGRLALSLPGARLIRAAPPMAGGGVFVIAALGAGSFDGLNETFWWLALIGVNPLEFPGRSAVIPQTLAGLLGSAALLTAAFAACVWCGLALARATPLFPRAFGRFALTLAPILAGYHFAHYLTSALVNGQYALAAATDPLASGADLLGLGPFHVTTSFFNLYHTVRLIWLAQAGAIVLGHVLGVIAAHAVALELLGDPRRAALSQVPLAGFMVLYTLFGLWLLAQPTGA